MAHRTTRSIVSLALAALAVAACGGTGVVTSALVDATDAGPVRASSPAVDADSPAAKAAASASAPTDPRSDAGQVDAGASDAEADTAVDSAVAPECPGFVRIDVPIGDCLYLNGGTCLALNPDGSPDCLTSYPCSPVGHCTTAQAVMKPLVFYTSPESPDARRILHVGACPEVCL